MKAYQIKNGQCFRHDDKIYGVLVDAYDTLNDDPHLDVILLMTLVNGVWEQSLRKTDGPVQVEAELFDPNIDVIRVQYRLVGLVEEL